LSDVIRVPAIKGRSWERREPQIQMSNAEKNPAMRLIKILM